ncbi:MAG: DUF2080 family transposase-associated protein [Deltaproteobacteria bacterium]|nr:MAG: DUF2080 family transposase-associated protein [Deltaproteobacteria bacterium]
MPSFDTGSVSCYSGNSGRVYLPPEWIGRHVKIIQIGRLVEEGMAEEIKTRKIRFEDVFRIIAFQEALIKKKVSRKWIQMGILFSLLLTPCAIWN